jgi:hypothetical protein
MNAVTTSVPAASPKSRKPRVWTAFATLMSIAIASFFVSRMFIGPAPAGGPIAAVVNDGLWWTIALLSIVRLWSRRRCGAVK